MSNSKQIFLLGGGRPSGRETLFSPIKTVFKENMLTSPTVAYVGTANGDDENSFKRSVNTLTEAGASNVSHALISPDNADLKEAQKILNAADIVFISGGDVEKGIEVLKKKKIIDFLHEIYEQGKPFFGNSAGSIMLAKSWVRWKDPDDDSSAELFSCLGLAPIICDTHGEQDNWEELKAALKLSEDGEKGYGIVSGTAIKVYPNGKVEALGGAVNQFIRSEGKIVRLPDILPTL